MTRIVVSGLAALLLAPAVALAQGPGRGGPQQFQRGGDAAPWMQAIQRLAHKVDQLEQHVKMLVERQQKAQRFLQQRRGMQQRHGMRGQQFGPGMHGRGPQQGPMQGRFGRMGGPGGPAAHFEGGRHGPMHGEQARSRKQDRSCEHLCDQCQAKAKAKHRGKGKGRRQAAAGRPHAQTAPARPAGADIARRLHAENARLKQELAKLKAEFAKLKMHLKKRAG